MCCFCYYLIFFTSVTSFLRLFSLSRGLIRKILSSSPPQIVYVIVVREKYIHLCWEDSGSHVQIKRRISWSVYRLLKVVTNVYSRNVLWERWLLTSIEALLQSGISDQSKLCHYSIFLKKLNIQGFNQLQKYWNAQVNWS